jgi:hypothetical protein
MMEGSKLPKYEQKLLQILKNRDAKGLNAYTRKLFQDCFAFVKQESGAKNVTPLAMEFVKNQAELDAIGKRISMFAHQREKPKYPSLSLIVWNKFNAKIFVNMGFFYELLKNKGCQSFIITLTDNYLHELVHYFYRPKTEQEVHNTQCELLESFLGITLPIEAKKIQSSEFYHEEKRA